MKKIIYLLLGLICLFVLFGCDNNTESKQEQLAQVVISPEQGVYYEPQTVTMSHEVSGVQIRYTLDGTTPNDSSTLYADAFTVNDDVVIKAIAYKSGFKPSEIKRVNIVVNEIPLPELPMVQFSLAGGLYVEAQNVTMINAVTGAEIRYTTDNSEPTEESTLYTGQVTLTQTCVLKAKAFKENFISSPTASLTFTLRPVNAGEMVLVQGGTFMMGSEDGDPDEEPVHQVELSSFYIGKYEVTQNEWNQVMSSNPSFFTDNGLKPVENVKWSEAIRYCNLKSVQEGLEPCYYVNGNPNPDNWPGETEWSDVLCNWEKSGYRLPTEAEWEYASRGGLNNHNYKYSGSNDINQVGWHLGNSNNHTNLIGLKNSNELGIYDMTGNVFEWVWDFYGPYTVNSVLNPSGPASGTERVIRGGSWDVPSDICYVSFRDCFGITFQDTSLGLRVVKKAQ